MALMMWQERESVPAGCSPLSTAGEQACAGIDSGAEIEGFTEDAILAAVGEADVLTFDHEVVPPELLDRLAQRVRLAPTPTQMRYSHKDHQRRAFAAAGYPVPEFAVVHTEEELSEWISNHPSPWLLKAAFGGYDGRGVLIFEDPDIGFRYLRGCGTAVAEELLDLSAEAAVLTCRSADGSLKHWPVVDTVQVDGMCAEVTYPSQLSEHTQRHMIELARSIAEFVDSQGVLAVEFFIVGERVYINELAPRPHNSGHLTIEGSQTSQFVNHLRGVLGLDLGPTEMTAPAVAMVNLVGPEAAAREGGSTTPTAAAVWKVKDATVHWYGKSSRPGRKLGHVTALGDNVADALHRARSAAEAALAQVLGSGRMVDASDSARDSRR